VKEIRNVLAVAHQSSGLDVFAQCEYRRQMFCEREFGNSPTLPKENGIHRHHDRWHAFVGKRSEGVLDFPRVARNPPRLVIDGGTFHGVPRWPR
jgi:hypothetical protein